jgi:ribosomal protein S27AE
MNSSLSSPLLQVREMSGTLGPHARQCPPSGGAPSGGEFVPPAEFVSRARELRCQGTSISFNEPTLNLEWSLEVFHVARAAGLYNTFVTNGYQTIAPGHPGEHTFCPNCGTILARRGLLQLLHCDVTPDGQCPRCGQEIAGAGWAWKRRGPTLAPGKGVFSKQLS